MANEVGYSVDMTKHIKDAVAKRIVASIIDDIKGRWDIGDAWEMLRGDTQDDIEEAWRNIVTGVLDNATQPEDKK